MKQIFILKESLNKICSGSDFFKNIKKVNIDQNQENLILTGLNTANEPIFNEVVFKGGLNSCIIDPKTIFRLLFINNCNAFILSHNHPSSNLKPSEEDIKIYNLFKEMGEILSIKCLDSIIFNENNFYSLRGA